MARRRYALALVLCLAVAVALSLLRLPYLYLSDCNIAIVGSNPTASTTAASADIEASRKRSDDTSLSQKNTNIGVSTTGNGKEDEVVTDGADGSHVATSNGDDLSHAVQPIKPWVVWLMSFPNSGTTYTLKLIQQYTHTTTATNYGNEQGRHGTSVPIYQHGDDSSISFNGPFWRHPGQPRPKDFVLTKTHCGGNAMVANPDGYIQTKRSFDVACRTGNRLWNDTKVPVTYGRNIVQRAVHLIRDPFDNIVARFHMRQKNWKADPKKAARLNVMNDTKQGFQIWCRDQDRMGRKAEAESKWYDSELWEAAREAPCHAEFIRYTWWHNHAIEVTAELKRFDLSYAKDLTGHADRQSTTNKEEIGYVLPTLILFYEDYEAAWNQTASQLLDFLRLRPSSDDAVPLEFIPGKHYRHYYAVEDMRKIRQLIKLVASPATWDLLSRYF